MISGKTYLRAFFRDISKSVVIDRKFKLMLFSKVKIFLKLVNISIYPCSNLLLINMKDPGYLLLFNSLRYKTTNNCLKSDGNIKVPSIYYIKQINFIDS